MMEATRQRETASEFVAEAEGDETILGIVVGVAAWAVGGGGERAGQGESGAIEGRKN